MIVEIYKTRCNNTKAIGLAPTLQITRMNISKYVYVYFRAYIALCVEAVPQHSKYIRTKTKICFYLCVSKYAFSRPELV